MALQVSINLQITCKDGEAPAKAVLEAVQELASKLETEGLLVKCEKSTFGFNAYDDGSPPTIG